MTKLKIAVQFFGHLRTFEKCAPSVNKYILSRYDCDVFMHTWSETEHRTLTWHKGKGKVHPVDDKLAAKVKKLYNLKKLEIENQNTPENDISIPCLHNNGKHSISAAGMNFMLYSQTRVNDLRKKYAQSHSIRYDYVLMIRPDILIEKPLNLEALDSEVKASVDFPARISAVNALAVSENFSFITDLGSDILYLASPQDMDAIAEVLKKTDVTDYKDRLWTLESLINRILIKNNIVTLPLFYYWQRDWEVVRSGISSREKRRGFIIFKITPRFLKFHLLALLPFSFLNFTLTVFNKFTIDVSVGKRRCQTLNL